METLSSFSVALASSFSLVGLAEIGDKSQLVCITLAMRYRAVPVLFGAIFAFVFLNLAAVLVGAVAANWIPEHYVRIIVAMMFFGFGIHALTSKAEDEDDEIKDMKNHGIMVSTFLLILLAEFGDKTQIAVAGLASTANVTGVWTGATLALATTSALGVIAGRTIVNRVPVVFLHRLSGSLFILFGVISLLSL